jgi:hypothetical protein
VDVTATHAIGAHNMRPGFRESVRYSLAKTPCCSGDKRMPTKERETLTAHVHFLIMALGSAVVSAGMNAHASVTASRAMTNHQIIPVTCLNGTPPT